MPYSLAPTTRLFELPTRQTQEHERCMNPRFNFMSTVSRLPHLQELLLLLLLLLLLWAWASICFKCHVLATFVMPLPFRRSRIKANDKFIMIWTKKEKKNMTMIDRYDIFGIGRSIYFWSDAVIYPCRNDLSISQLSHQVFFQNDD